MRICIVQPEYSTEYDRSDALFEAQLALFDRCDDTMDIIVFPESCDAPCLAGTKALLEKSVERYNTRLLEKARETAKRCNALLFINAKSRTEKGLRNTTYAFDRTGQLVGTYHKQHLTPGEVAVMELDSDYTFEYSQPVVLELEGFRFGFLVCYDAYFYESYANMARQDLDAVIVCSHQRSDTHRALEILSQFLAYHTNAYVIRSSVSMGEASRVGGASMVVAPTGEILCHMGSRVGMETVDVDLTRKYYKPAGFGNPDAAHYAYLEKGRRPWKYRPAGSAIALPEDWAPYPRVCANRGLSTVAPENSLPAFGAAVALGAEEIALDLRITQDAEPVLCREDALERVSTGAGSLSRHTCQALLAYDFGVKYSEKFQGLQLLRLEALLKKLACHTVMNIQLQAADAPFDPEGMKKLLRLIDGYDCRRYVYFTAESEEILQLAAEMAPDICRCAWGEEPQKTLDMALRWGCGKLQLPAEKYDKALLEAAHSKGLRCNALCRETPGQAEALLALGVDTILTGDYHRVAQLVKREK